MFVVRGPMQRMRGLCGFLLCLLAACTVSLAGPETDEAQGGSVAIDDVSAADEVEDSEPEKQPADRTKTPATGAVAAGDDTKEVPVDSESADSESADSDSAQEITTACDEAGEDDSMETAADYIPGTVVHGCIAQGDDDWFALTTPDADVAGGYYQLRLTGLDAPSEIDIHAGRDGTELYSTYNSEGGELHVYWSGAPGETYYVNVRGWVASAFKYDLEIAYTAVEDPYEPNDVIEEAKPIQLGETVEAMLFGGLVGGLSRGACLVDYYAIELEPGEAKFAVEQLAADVTQDVTVYGPEGGEVATFYQSNAGMSYERTFRVSAPGVHQLAISYWVDAPAGAGRYDFRERLPQSYVQPYLMTITQ